MPAELTPTTPAVIAAAEQHGYSVDGLLRLLDTQEAKAILAVAEQRAVDLINGLPSKDVATLDAATGKPVITPGWKTSEFWTLVVFFLLSLFTMLASVVPPKWALLCDVVVAGLYQVSRGLAKHGTGN